MSRSRRLVVFVSGVLALILAILWWQQRTAVQGPNGHLYVLTDSASGSILEITPTL